MLRNFMVCCLVFPILLNAQTSVSVSEEMIMPEGTAYEITGKVGENIILVMNKNEDTEVYAFDDIMQMRWKRELLLDVKRTDLLGTVNHHDGTFSIIYHYQKKNATHIALRRYNDALSIVDSAQVRTFNIGILDDKPNILFSEDYKSFVVYNFPSSSKMDITAFNMTTQKVLWEQTHTFEDLNRDRDLVAMELSNAGDFFLIFQRDNFRTSRKKNRFIIFKLSESPSEQVPIFMEEQLISDANFAYDNLHQQLIGAGTYDELSNEKARGVFLMRIPTNQIRNYHFSFLAFDADFINSVNGKGGKERNTFGDIATNNLILKKNGGALLVIERHKTLSSNLNNNFQPSYFTRQQFFEGNTDYFYDDMIVVSIAPTGEIEWKDILFKSQFSQNDDGMFSSYFLMKNKNSLRFIFNEEIRRENSVSEYLLTAAGTHQRKNLFHTENKKIQLRLRDGLQIAANEAVFPSENRRWLKLVRLRYSLQ